MSGRFRRVLKLLEKCRHAVSSPFTDVPRPPQLKTIRIFSIGNVVEKICSIDYNDVGMFKWLFLFLFYILVFVRHIFGLRHIFLASGYRTFCQKYSCLHL